MRLEEMKKRVREVRARQADDEFAHALEDANFRDLVDLIAHPERWANPDHARPELYAPDVLEIVALAKECLKTRRLKFRRDCA